MRKKAFLHLSCFILAIMLLLLSACEPPGFLTISKTTLDPDFLYSASISATDLQSATATATQTLTDTPSPTADNTSTTSITPNIIPTQFFGFADARVYQSYADHTETIFYFIVPGVAAPYFGTVDGYDLTCEPDTNQANLLVCRSNENLFGSNLKDFVFFADQDHTFLVYEGAFATYLHIIMATPTPAGFIWPRADFSPADVTWGYTPSNCPVRGLNLICETEYRRYDDNSCLVGMSCFDSCGFYYAVDTIKNKSGAYSFSGPCW
jgi:hypothetical protein